MTKKETFLQIFREYETAIREDGLTTQQYEDSQTSEKDKDKLRYCRVTRNYLSHAEDTAFIEVTDAQISYLKGIVDELKSRKDIVKKHTVSLVKGSCTGKDRCQEVLLKMAKAKIEKIVLVTNNQYSIVSVYSIIDVALSSKTTIMDAVKPTKERPVFIKSTDEYGQVPKGTIAVVTDTGDEHGKVAGILYK